MGGVRYRGADQRDPAVLRSPGDGCWHRGETCSRTEAKLDADLGSAVVQKQHVAGVPPSQRKMLGSLINIPERL